MRNGWMQRTVLLATLVLGGAGLASAHGGRGAPMHPPTGPVDGYGAGSMGGSGPGMLGGYGHEMMDGYGPGRMGGGTMGGAMTGGGMMFGAMGPVPSDARPLAQSALEERLQSVLPRFAAGARIADVMPFANNVYAQVVDQDGNGLAELLVDRFTGVVTPEPGPNMMWNTRGWGMGTAGGGMMGPWGGNSGAVDPNEMMGSGGTQRGMMGSAPSAAQEPRYDEVQARALADGFLQGYAPGATVLQAQAFPGYYTFDYGSGAVQGMLSVNAYTGSVWPHTWHGAYQGTTEP